ncbi:hypothetical protein RFI_08035 [Reticulomyxa filosa]|uniref:Uncharacterized protein n=1 Tax=Reticulomyxa filosa TaxID=46433 RepID=X6NS31_RETFI|nr:hypothetical protein RFI_08035 [Reticulomyxa filosa]|eukprot:ETO29090.1 hypothetical protein RFI_08035 [Reticulomyxa filosa]
MLLHKKCFNNKNLSPKKRRFFFYKKLFSIFIFFLKKNIDYWKEIMRDFEVGLLLNVAKITFHSVCAFCENKVSTRCCYYEPILSLINPMRHHEEVIDRSFNVLVQTLCSPFRSTSNEANINDTNTIKCRGGMQNDNVGNSESRKYAKEIKTLLRLFGSIANKEELQQKIEYYNGNIELVIKDVVQQSIEKEV